MDNQLTVLIGEKEYTISHPTLFEDTAWRERLWEVIGKCTAGIKADDLENIDMAAVLPYLGGRGIRDLIELMFLYAPSVIGKDRKRIEAKLKREEITEDEIIAAATKVYEFAAVTVKKTLTQMISASETLMAGLEAFEIEIPDTP